MSRLLAVPLCLALVAMLLSACAGTARGKKSSVYQHDGTVKAVDTSRSRADAMVIIRYPAVVDADAESAFYNAYEQHAIGGEVESESFRRSPAQQVSQAIIAKSNYFSMSLYRELQDRLPANSVLLSPHMITLDDERRLNSQPLLAAEQIPAVLTIDFNVYSFPDPREMMNSEPLTFGDIVTPLFVVHSNRWLRPSTHGLLLSSEPLAGSAWEHSREQASLQVSNRYRDRSGDQIFESSRQLDFVTFLRDGERPRRGVPVKSAAQPPRPEVAVEVHPLEKIQMEPQLFTQLTASPANDPFAEDFAKGAATRVIQALNRIDHDRASFFNRQIALSRFDPSLGEAVLSRSRSESIKARLRMAESLIEAEKKFLAAQSKSLYQGTFENDYGDQMRQMLTAEFRLLEQRREIARQQNISTAIAIVAMAGAVYAGSNNGGDILSSQTAYNIGMLSSIWAANRAIALHAQSRTIGENFLMQMAPAINRQVTVQLEWLESRQQITASDFEEFREKTMALYQRSVRSTDHVFDPNCEFFHPDYSSRGRWFGLCREGKAYSDGYGLVMDDNGSVVEYLGRTRDGMAFGRGSMIVSEAAGTGPIYYEGAFENGLPSGIVLVEKPNSRPAIRTFQQGQDKGSANPEDWEKVAF